MSTRSFICLEHEKGRYTGIYCHSDGYLTHNGAKLLDFYNTRDRVEQLLTLGDISYLGERLYPHSRIAHGFDYDIRQEEVTVAYGRDRGEKDTEASEVCLEELKKDEWIEYIYIFTQSNEWKYFSQKNYKSEFHSLKDDLLKEYQSAGLERQPLGFYGFWSDDRLKNLKEREKLSPRECCIHRAIEENDDAKFVRDNDLFVEFSFKMLEFLKDYGRNNLTEEDYDFLSRRASIIPQLWDEARSLSDIKEWNRESLLQIVHSFEDEYQREFAGQAEEVARKGHLKEIEADM